MKFRAPEVIGIETRRKNRYHTELQLATPHLKIESLRGYESFAPPQSALERLYNERFHLSLALVTPGAYQRTLVLRPVEAAQTHYY